MRTKFDWTTELERWLEPFLSRLAHKARRRMCPLYIAGLIGPGERKSIQPMAQWLVPGEYDQLHHFAAAGMWDATPLEAELLVQAVRLVGGDNAVSVMTTRHCRRRAAIRLALPRNMPLPWARQPIARRWCQQRWRAAKCR